MLSANKGSFTFSFPISEPFISFYCPFTLAGTSSTMLNRHGESGHPCFVSDLGERAFSYSLLSIMLTVGFPQVRLIMLRKLSSTSTLLSVYNMKESDFSIAFSTSNAMWLCNFFPSFHQYVTLIFIFLTPLHSSDKSSFGMVYKNFATIFFAHILLQAFSCWVIRDIGL